MATINEIQDEIIEEFEAFDDFMDRYAYIIELGTQLPEMPETLKTPSNKIEGCQSRVWVNVALTDDKRLAIHADSDSSIVKGITALVCRVFDGQSPVDVRDADLYFIDRIGLHDHLTPTRSNGLQAIIGRINGFARAYAHLISG